MSNENTIGRNELTENQETQIAQLAKESANAWLENTYKGDWEKLTPSCEAEGDWESLLELTQGFGFEDQYDPRFDEALKVWRETQAEIYEAALLKRDAEEHGKS